MFLVLKLIIALNLGSHVC